MNEDPRDLERTQRWMQAVIMHPHGVTDGMASPAARSQIDVSADDIERVIERSRAQTSIERLQVYGNAYFARLVGVLEDEFPATRHAIGDEAFEGFAFGYLQSHPSRSYTLAELSVNFARFLQETRPPREESDEGADWVDFLIDLCALERTYSEVFSAEGPERGRHLTPADLAEIPPARWGDVRLTPTPCLRLMTFRFPVHEYATGVRRGEDPAPPGAAETLLVIGRRDFVVRRQAVSRPQFELLRQIVEGRTLGDAIEQVVEATDVELESLAEQIGGWFKTWATGQFFQAVEIA